MTEFETALHDVIGGIVERSRQEMKKEKPWPDLWKDSEHGLESLLSSACWDMQKTILALADVIQEKFQIKCSNRLCDLLQALPFAMDVVKETINREQGHVCCADKARNVYYEEVLAEINRIKNGQA
jgi:hypothetical protein